MLTGYPPLSYLPPEVAREITVSRPINIVATLTRNVSQDAKEFLMAALTWLVLLIERL